jgi:hypothetical protein
VDWFIEYLQLSAVCIVELEAFPAHELANFSAALVEAKSRSADHAALAVPQSDPVVRPTATIDPFESC